MNNAQNTQSVRYTARQIIDLLADHVARELILAPEDLRDVCTSAFLEGLCQECSENGISVTDADRNYFTEIVASRFKTMSATISPGNDWVAS